MSFSLNSIYIYFVMVLFNRRGTKTSQWLCYIKINLTFSDLDLKFAVQNTLYRIFSCLQTRKHFSAVLHIFSICLCNAFYRSCSLSFIFFFSRSSVRFLCRWLLSLENLFLPCFFLSFCCCCCFGSWRFTEMDKKVLIANKPNYFSSFWLLTIFIWYEWANLRIELKKSERHDIRERAVNMKKSNDDNGDGGQQHQHQHQEYITRNSTELRGHLANVPKKKRTGEREKTH